MEMSLLDTQTQAYKPMEADKLSCFKRTHTVYPMSQFMLWRFRHSHELVLQWKPKVYAENEIEKEERTNVSVGERNGKNVANEEKEEQAPIFHHANVRDRI